LQCQETFGFEYHSKLRPVEAVSQAEPLVRSLGAQQSQETLGFEYHSKLRPVAPLLIDRQKHSINEGPLGLIAATSSPSYFGLFLTLRCNISVTTQAPCWGCNNPSVKIFFNTRQHRNAFIPTLERESKALKEIFLSISNTPKLLLPLKNYCCRLNIHRAITAESINRSLIHVLINDISR
jgi:hypothetical protein